MLDVPPVTLFFLAANLVIGAYTLLSNPGLIGEWAFRPYRVVREREWSRWLTAGFVHVGFLHLAFNMWALYLFGPYVEAAIGSARFVALYIGSDLAANALTYLKYKDRPEYSAVGASGAISGVIFAFCLFEPFSTLQLIIPPIPIWAIVFAPLYIAISIYAARREMGRVAHEAHIGGALGGLALTVLLYPPSLGIFLSQLGL